MKVHFERCAESFTFGLKDIVTAEFKDVAVEAIAAGTSFLEFSRDQMETWALQLSVGEISQKDFEWNMASLRDLAAMESLKAAGLSSVRIQQFRGRLIGLACSSAKKMFVV